MYNAQQIEQWICNYIADILAVPVENVSPSASFDRLGLDSSSAVALVGDLEAWMNMDIEATLPYEYQDVRALSGKLADMHAALRMKADA